MSFISIYIYCQDNDYIDRNLLDARYEFLTDLCDKLSKENLNSYSIDDLKYYLTLAEELIAMNAKYGYQIDMDLLNQLKEKLNSKISYYLKKEKFDVKMNKLKADYENSIIRFIFTGINNYTYRANHNLPPDEKVNPDVNLFSVYNKLDIKLTFNCYYKLNLSLSDRFNINIKQYYDSSTNSELIRNMLYDGIYTGVINKFSPGIADFSFLDIYMNFDAGIENISSDNLSFVINPMTLRFKDAEYPIPVLWEYTISFPLQLNLIRTDMNQFTVSNYFKIGVDIGNFGAMYNGAIQILSDDRLDYNCRFFNVAKTDSNLQNSFRLGVFYSIYFFSTWLYYRLESGYDYDNIFIAYNASGIEVGANFYFEYFVLGINYTGKYIYDDWNSNVSVCLTFRFPVYHHENFIFPAFLPGVLRDSKFWE